MTKDEALKLALEALVLNNAKWKHLADSGDAGNWRAEDQDHFKQTEEAITAFKEALAQPEQEPVACVEYIPCCTDKTCSKCKAATPPQRTWTGLTDGEVDKMILLMGFPPDWITENAIVKNIVRNLEAKLKEKNNG